MNPITAFDPTVNTSGIIATNGINQNEQIVLYNSSLSCLQLEFADHTKDTIPPSWAKSWIKQSPLANIKYSTLFTVPLTGQPVSQLYGTVYEAGEHVADVNNALQYVYVVGNPGGIAVSTVTELVNTGNASGTPIINTNSTAATGQTTNVTNDGLWSLACTIAGALVTFFKSLEPASTGNDILQLGAVNYITHILGALGVSGTSTLDNGNLVSDGNGNWATNGTLWQFLNGITLNSHSGVHIKNGAGEIFGDTSGNTNIQANSGQNTVILGSGTQGSLHLGCATSGDILDTTSTATFIKAPNGNLQFQSPNGTTKWALTAYNGNFANMSSGTTISHGLGGTPQEITVLPAVTQPGSGTAGAGNNGSSTFQCTIGTGSSGWWSAAIH